uniref:Uncharacterized protein n=1 Tax=Eutreptiella gymnastica TaxID=73025 RepID=A0A7S4D0Q6_9EUGL
MFPISVTPITCGGSTSCLQKVTRWTFRSFRAAGASHQLWRVPHTCALLVSGSHWRGIAGAFAIGVQCLVPMGEEPEEENMHENGMLSWMKVIRRFWTVWGVCRIPGAVGSGTIPPGLQTSTADQRCAALRSGGLLLTSCVMSRTVHPLPMCL